MTHLYIVMVFLTTVALRTSQSHTHLNNIRYYNQTHLLGKKYIFNIKHWIIISSISKYITLCKKKRRKKKLRLTC